MLEMFFSGKTAEPKMAFNFAHLLSAACGGAPRRLGRLRRPWRLGALRAPVLLPHSPQFLLSAIYYSLAEISITRS